MQVDYAGNTHTIPLKNKDGDVIAVVRAPARKDINGRVLQNMRINGIMRGEGVSREEAEKIYAAKLLDVIQLFLKDPANFEPEKTKRYHYLYKKTLTQPP